jgi:hypothetical protein
MRYPGIIESFSDREIIASTISLFLPGLDKITGFQASFFNITRPDSAAFLR